MEFDEKFCEWELKHGLFEKGFVRGFAFYSLLRRELVNTTLNKSQGITQDPFAAKGQTVTGLKLFLRLMKKSEKTKVKNPDLLILCHPRRNRTGDVYESVFTDYLEEAFENSVTLERLFDDHSHFEPAMTKNLCYVDRIVLKSYLVRILASKLKKKEYAAIKSEVKAIMDGPLDDLEDIYKVDVDRKKYYERAVTLFYFYNSRKKDFDRFLNKLKPKMMVEVVCKSVDAMILNELCRDKGIPVVEIQHSLLGPIAKYPKGIFEKQSPEYYLSYSDYWSEYQTYPIAEENVYACGSPYFERQVKQYKKSVDKGQQTKKKVLFISGMAYGDKLSKVAIQLNEIAGEAVEITYKLHPDEFGCWRNLYPELEKSGIKVVDSKDVSIYEFFNDSDAQVGVFSTAIYEGIAFGPKTYILNIPFAAEFIDFCKAGYGTLIENGQQLWDDLQTSSSANNGADMSEKFWKSNAKEKVISTLKSIFEKHHKEY